jgi:hypothetical protein
LLGHDKFEFAKTYCSLHVAQRSQGKTYQVFISCDCPYCQGD